MNTLDLTIGTSEVSQGGKSSLMFRDPILYLRVGGFSGSKLDVKVQYDSTVESMKVRRNAWKGFVLNLDGVRALSFVKRPDPFTLKWYQTHMTGTIPWLQISGYDSSRPMSWERVPEETIQIHNVKVHGAFAMTFGDVISVTYTGITKIYWGD